MRSRLTLIVVLCVVAALALAMLPSLSLQGFDPDGWGGDPLEPEYPPDLGGKGLRRTKGPKGLRRPIRPNTSMNGTISSNGSIGNKQTASSRPAHPRIEAIQNRPAGIVRLQVFDAITGRPIEAFRYRLYGPGTKLESHEVEGHQAVVGLRLGMPSNLTVEADGYAPADVRQILLTKDERVRQLLVRLRRGSR